MLRGLLHTEVWLQSRLSKSGRAPEVGQEGLLKTYCLKGLRYDLLVSQSRSLS